MPLGTWIAGRYSSTLNSQSLGIMENGYELQIEPKGRAIGRSDAYGDTLLDWCYSGIDFHLMCESLEYITGTIAAINPYGALGVMGVISRLASDIATALVLTATAGTPAAATPASLTATKAILAMNANPRLLFNSELRKVPIRFSLLPYDSGGGAIKWVTQT